MSLFARLTPLPDLQPPDPFGAYRRGPGLLARVPGVRVIVPGHGHVGDRAAFRLREEWPRAEHERQRDYIAAG